MIRIALSLAAAAVISSGGWPAFGRPADSGTQPLKVIAHVYARPHRLLTIAHVVARYHAPAARVAAR